MIELPSNPWAFVHDVVASKSVGLVGRLDYLRPAVSEYVGRNGGEFWQTRLEARLQGNKLRLFSIDNPDGLRGPSFDRVVVFVPPGRTLKPPTLEQIVSNARLCVRNGSPGDVLFITPHGEGDGFNVAQWT